MNALDGALLAVIALSTVVGIMRGLMREVIGFLAIVASTALAYFGAPAALSIVGDYGVPAYVLVSVTLFVGGLIGFIFLGRLMRTFLKALHLGGVDRGLGALFGLARAAVLTSLALVVLVLVMDPHDALMRRSNVLRIEAPGVEWIGSRIPVDRIRSEFHRKWAIVRGAHSGPWVSVEPQGSRAKYPLLR